MEALHEAVTGAFTMVNWFRGKVCDWEMLQDHGGEGMHAGRRREPQVAGCSR